MAFLSHSDGACHRMHHNSGYSEPEKHTDRDSGLGIGVGGGGVGCGVWVWWRVYMGNKGVTLPKMGGGGGRDTKKKRRVHKPFHGNMSHVFDGAKLFIPNTHCHLRPGVRTSRTCL